MATTPAPVKNDEQGTAWWVKVIIGFLIVVMMFFAGVSVNNISVKANVQAVDRLTDIVNGVRIDRREKWLKYERDRAGTQECLADIKAKLQQLLERQRELLDMLQKRGRK